MIRIEWIEIPAGKFISGLTTEQRTMIERDLYEGYGIGNLDSTLRRWVEDTLKKPMAEYTPGEKQIWKQEALREYSPLLEYQRAWHALQRIPDAKSRDLPVFYIARFPITYAQVGSALAEKMGWRKENVIQEPDRPAMFAYWEQAEALAHWLGGRLPIPLEWEKAARGTDGRLYPWGDEWNPGAGNFGTPECRQGGDPKKRRGIVTAVDAYPEGASPYGVMDMVGNLGEWLALTEDNQIGYMGYSIKELSYYNTWFWALPVHRRGATRDWLWYVGCRPVLTEWSRRLWPGYRPELD